MARILPHCGKTGLKMPQISLGLWHNFGDISDFAVMRQILPGRHLTGITDLTLPIITVGYGAAERNFGKIMAMDLKPYRDEMLVTTKTRFRYVAGPYGDCEFAQISAGERLTSPSAV